VVESAAANFVSEFKDTMAEGNLLVFDELGTTVESFLAARQGGPDAVRLVVDAILDTPEGSSFLRRAFDSYLRAAQSPDPVERAQLILAGNLCAVYHEQQRLQPLLERTLRLPLLGDLLGPLLSGGIARREWRRFATRFLLQYDLPGISLKAGRDVKSAFPGASFPADVDELDQSGLAGATWRELCGDAASTRGSAAADWADLSDRMQFIATVFRARQQDTGLLSPPFTRFEVESLRMGILPPAYVVA
jgi:hypothetical protein